MTAKISSLCVVILFSTVLFPSDRLGVQHAHTGGRALIVGIEHYKNPLVPETPGCVKDAQSLARFVETKYGFAHESIKVLLNEEATAENIDHWFNEWLIKGTKPGERVFFSYAGHGSQLPELRKGSERDGKDETIAPYDVNPMTGENEIRDDRFEELIAQLSGRMAVLLFDSCHSGTISRGLPPVGPLHKYTHGGGARYLPGPDQFKALLADGSRASGGGYTVESVTTSRDLLPPPFVKPEKIAGVAGVVVISAARYDQRAYPMDVNGDLRGALSYIFETSQQGTEFPILKDLEQRIVREMQDLYRQRKLGAQQDPQFEVISSIPLDLQPLFGGNEIIPQVALANPLSPIKINVRTLEGKTSYRIGESVSYEVKTDTPGYLYLVVFSEQNVATCIFPYRDAQGHPENNYISGSVRLPISAGGFPVQDPPGRDLVVALLSPAKLNLGEREDGTYTWDEVFGRLNQRQLQESIGKAVSRGQGVKRPGTIDLQGANWQAVTLLLQSTR